MYNTFWRRNLEISVEKFVRDHLKINTDDDGAVKSDRKNSGKNLKVNKSENLTKTSRRKTFNINSSNNVATEINKNNIFNSNNVATKNNKNNVLNSNTNKTVPSATNFNSSQSKSKPQHSNKMIQTNFLLNVMKEVPRKPVSSSLLKEICPKAKLPFEPQSPLPQQPKRQTEFCDLTQKEQRTQERENYLAEKERIKWEIKAKNKFLSKCLKENMIKMMPGKLEELLVDIMRLVLAGRPTVKKIYCFISAYLDYRLDRLGGHWQLFFINAVTGLNYNKDADAVSDAVSTEVDISQADPQPVGVDHPGYKGPNKPPWYKPPQISKEALDKNWTSGQASMKEPSKVRFSEIVRAIIKTNEMNNRNNSREAASDGKKGRMKECRLLKVDKDGLIIKETKCNKNIKKHPTKTATTTTAAITTTTAAATTTTATTTTVAATTTASSVSSPRVIKVDNDDKNVANGDDKVNKEHEEKDEENGDEENEDDDVIKQICAKVDEANEERDDVIEKQKQEECRKVKRFYLTRDEVIKNMTSRVNNAFAIRTNYIRCEVFPEKKTKNQINQVNAPKKVKNKLENKEEDSVKVKYSVEDHEIPEQDTTQQQNTTQEYDQQQLEKQNYSDTQQQLQQQQQQQPQQQQPQKNQNKQKKKCQQKRKSYNVENLKWHLKEMTSQLLAMVAVHRPDDVKLFLANQLEGQFVARCNQKGAYCELVQEYERERKALKKQIRLLKEQLKKNVTNQDK
ncbi:hypothetical protein HELRODRAFT_190659 [Helobdella robusta]|uniref:Uncharacterized protein n=1 Tax=Helobdella robusta TaxID=6412 RepID=T1FS65_HELRO|nr:hypothetical protein HELRODRAFT_190659 [Helobdella robusta]ESO08912.1 hypothetical protein HELRODRAFT_190659 [Helobdella robusta]